MWKVGLSTALKIAVQIQGRQNVSNLGGGEALIKESHLISLLFFFLILRQNLGGSIGPLAHKFRHPYK